MDKKRLLLFVFLLVGYGLSAQTDTCACCTENHKAFDFWIGKWTVTNPDGSAAGKNTINKIQNGCALQENWTSAKGGYTGVSHNFYNATKKRWEQVWIDNGGAQLKLYGNKKRVKSLKIIKSKNNLNLLEFDVQWITSKGPTNDEFRILIPNDKMIEAEKIIATF